jgi:hypothetical protein
MASLREIMAAEISVGAYGAELIDTTVEFIPPQGLAIGSLIPMTECTINTAFQIVRYGAFRTRTGAITAEGDYTGTVADAVSVTSADHGLVTGQKVTITITGDDEYNGEKEIVVINHNTFYFVHPHAFMGDYGVGTWTSYTSIATEEITAKNWLDTALAVGTLLFPNWNQPFYSITLTSGSCMVYFVKI